MAMSTSAIMGEFQGWLSNVMRTEEGKQLLDDIGKAHSEHKKGSQALIGAREAAGEKRLAKDKTVTLDRILKIASVGLPLAGMLTGGKRPGKGAFALGALGKVAGGIDTMRTQGRGLQRERDYSMTMGNIEAEQRLLDTGLESQTGLAQTQFDVGQQGFENMLAATAEQRRGLSAAEKPMFTPGQLYQQGRNAAADARRVKSEDQKNILVQANQITRSLYGMEFVINSIQDLDEAIYDLKSTTFRRGLPPADPNHYMRIEKQLEALRDQYHGGGGLPMLPGGGTGSMESKYPGFNALSPADQQELIAAEGR